MTFIVWLVIGFYAACAIGACVVIYSALRMGCRADEQMRKF